MIASPISVFHQRSVGLPPSTAAAHRGTHEQGIHRTITGAASGALATSPSPSSTAISPKTSMKLGCGCGSECSRASTPVKYRSQDCVF